MAVMPVLAALLSGDPLHKIDLLTGSPVDDVVQMDRRMLADKFVHFDVQTGAELYWTGQQDFFVVAVDFPGVLRLPFPMVWMEWRVPKVVRMKGKLEKRPFPEHDPACAAALGEWPIEKGCERFKPLVPHITPECDHLLVIELFMHVDAEEPFVIVWPVVKVVQVDVNGTAVGSHHLWEGDQDNPELITAGMQWSQGMGDINVAFHALALINCRNVATADAGRVIVRRTAAQKRRREFGDVRYKTIVLPGTRGSKSGSQTGNHAEDMALHKVRGHFKHYSAEAPLLGKHVGTWWWGWNVRGNREHGENVNDYELGDFESLDE